MDYILLTQAESETAIFEATVIVNSSREKRALNALKRAMRRVNVNYRGRIHAKRGTSNNYFRRAPRLIQVAAAVEGQGGGQRSWTSLARRTSPSYIKAKRGLEHSA